MLEAKLRLKGKAMCGKTDHSYSVEQAIVGSGGPNGSQRRDRELHQYGLIAFQIGSIAWMLMVIGLVLYSVFDPAGFERLNTSYALYLFAIYVGFAEARVRFLQPRTPSPDSHRGRGS